MSVPKLKKLPNPPTTIEYKEMKFIICDAPTDSTLSLYINEFKEKHVSDVVIVCEPTYNDEPLLKEGIKVHRWPFPDGDSPSLPIIQKWQELVSNTFKKGGSAIAVHCVAGLGRAPALVAISLIDSGMEPLDSIAFLRSKRRGVINSKQMKWLESYGAKKNKKCLIM